MGTRFNKHHSRMQYSRASDQEQALELLPQYASVIRIVSLFQRDDVFDITANT
ncbi:hypothetical protein [Bacillus sp. SKDU12]|uniref:hypothetical protein n=1 Tax=Bacillus sp. SKDU12 TaxID=1337053 RepID=UPI00138986AC